MTQWNKLLKSLGFSESEATLYLTSLEMGPASVQDLAKRARVSRVTTYAVIETLTKQGLMSSVEKGKKKLYMAESPDRVLSFVQSRVKDMEATLHEVEGSLHELKLAQRGEKPVVRLFEGPEALKAIQDDVLRTRPKQLDEFGNLDEIHRAYPAEGRKDFFDELMRIGPKSRGVFLSKDRPPTVRNPANEQIIVLPHDKFDFYGDVFVYGNKIAYSTFRGKHISIIIESADLATTMRAFFEFLWHCLAAVPTPSDKK